MSLYCFSKALTIALSTSATAFDKIEKKKMKISCDTKISIQAQKNIHILVSRHA
jgi:hypothetical protein